MASSGGVKDDLAGKVVLDDVGWRWPAGAGVWHADPGAASSKRRPAATRLIVFWHADHVVGQSFDMDESCTDGIPASYQAPSVAPELLAHAEADAALDRSDPFEVDATVVICTRDRPEQLARCLNALGRQSCRPVQVVVVDNASGDGRTRAAAQAAGVDYVREERIGLDFARNRGVREARGSLILFTDDDVVLHPRWLERMARAFNNRAVDAVTGLVLPAVLETEAQWTFERQWSFCRGFVRRDFGADFVERHRTSSVPASEIGAGASMAFRRSCFARFGAFDERLDVGAAGCSGDSEYWHRILTHAGVCRYEPGAIAFHYHRPDVAGLRQQLRAYMRGHAAALLVQHENASHLGDRRRLFGTLPRWYAYLLFRRLTGERTPRTAYLTDQIRGLISGIAFYLRTPRPRRVFCEDVPQACVTVNAEPLVSVVVPAYNAEQTIDATLTSLRNQTHRRLEIIVVDDGSGDATAAMVLAHAGVDPRIRLIRQANGGVARARNTGLAAATAAFVAFVDADDLCAPERTAKLLAAMLRMGSDCALAYSWSAHVDDNGLVLAESQRSSHQGWVHDQLCRINFVGNGSAAMVRAEVARAVGGFDPLLRDTRAQGCEDIDFYLRIAQQHTFALVPQFLTGYRQSASNMSSDGMQMYRSFRIVERRHARRVPAARASLRTGRKYVLGWLISLAYLHGRHRTIWKLAPRLAMISPRWAYNIIISHSGNPLADPMPVEAAGTIANPSQLVRGARFPIGGPVAVAPRQA